MLSGSMDKPYPSATTLVNDRVASRLQRKDATLYDFSPEAQACAESYMGWADLASNPPCDIDEIVRFADEVAASPIDTIVIMGQGGSTQAPMTLTKYNKVDRNRIAVKTLDSDSPVRMREVFAGCKPETTMFIVSSKSGGTIEPRMYLKAVTDHYQPLLGDEFPKHLIAITDPGTQLERQAIEEGWAKVFSGVPEVGGRFSALSVFGLVPAAIAGIDIPRLLEHAREAERVCSQDSPDNPAINLAAFLYDNYRAGRDKFSFLTPKRGRVLGLWIEQLVAESLGKEGQGILPNIEVDTLLLADDPGDRSVIMYETKTDLWDERRNFEMSLAYLSPSIPRQSYKIDNVEELAEHFVMWEYATAMCGYLMGVCPFDQPDVQSTKTAVLGILADGIPEPDFVETFTPRVDMGAIEVRTSAQFKGCADLGEVLYELFLSIQHGDYLAINAFLPFTGEGRREALEAIRHSAATHFDVASCLEVGPRYLHSTGQLQKGGPNTGVFLVISADELKDIPLPAGSEAPSLGTLAKAQAAGDAKTLGEKGRRVVHLHLPDNSSITLRQLSIVVRQAIWDAAVAKGAQLPVGLKLKASTEEREV